ncbi:MAG: hypothetical protein ACJAVK_001772, partial [Akkermansiaceae bacterium]
PESCEKRPWVSLSKEDLPQSIHDTTRGSSSI